MKTKIYVVTGATSGIGKALVESLSKLDAIIFAGYRSEAKKEELASISTKIHPFYIDYAKIIKRGRPTNRWHQQRTTVITEVAHLFK